LIGGGMSENRGFSPQIAKAIDDEVAKIIEEGKVTARQALVEHREALNAISERLFEVETLEREEYEALLKQHGVTIQDAYRDEMQQELKFGDPSKAVV